MLLCVIKLKFEHQYGSKSNSLLTVTPRILPSLFSIHSIQTLASFYSQFLQCTLSGGACAPGLPGVRPSPHNFTSNSMTSNEGIVSTQHSLQSIHEKLPHVWWTTWITNENHVDKRMITHKTVVGYDLLLQDGKLHKHPMSMLQQQ